MATSANGGIPDDPVDFFERFLPERFAEDRARYRTAESAGAAAFEVIDVGAWAFRIRGGTLAVERGRPSDTLLQIAVSAGDFRAVFVDRARAELERSGNISDASRDAFRPIFAGARKGTPGTAGSTLAFRLDHEGERRRLYVTPGAGERTSPRATVMLSLDDFLALVGGRASAPGLAIRGRIGVRGDLAYALRLSVLLS